MQQQEKNRAIIISGLRAGRTVWEIIEFHNIKRSTVFSVKKKFNEFIASGDCLMISTSQGRPTGGAAMPRASSWPTRSGTSWRRTPAG